MYEVPIIDPKKLRAARGNRTLDEICAATGGVFCPQQLSGYEKGKNRPKLEKLPVLLKALGVTYGQVSSLISVEISISS
jgi:transcriptional regulator with XRE-family HTH domain